MNPQRSAHPVLLPLGPSRGLVEALVDEVRAACRVRGVADCPVTIDVADRHLPDVDPALLRDILAGLLMQAFANAARPAEESDAAAVREIVVTSVRLADTVEIEVADSGPPDPRAHAALEPLALAVGGRLTCAACPDGGRAVTLLLPQRPARRQAA